MGLRSGSQPYLASCTPYSLVEVRLNVGGLGDIEVLR